MTTFNEHNFVIYHQKNSHDLKQAKEKNDFIFEFKRKQRFRQRIAHSTSSQYKERKNVEQIVKISRELFER